MSIKAIVKKTSDMYTLGTVHPKNVLHDVFNVVTTNVSIGPLADGAQLRKLNLVAAENDRHRDADSNDH